MLWSPTGQLKKNTKSLKRWKCCSLMITGWRRESSGELKTSRGLFWHIEFRLYLPKKNSLFFVLLCRLKSLNLHGNCISEIPYLLLRGSFQPSVEAFEYGNLLIIALFKRITFKIMFLLFSSIQFSRKETLKNVCGDSHRCCIWRLQLDCFCSSCSSSAVILHLVTRDVSQA